MVNLVLKNDLKIQVELTSNCNSVCPGCSRFVEGSDIVNPNIDVGNKGNMKEHIWKKIFDDERIIKSLQEIVLSGAYGDFMLHPKAIDFINYAFKKGLKKLHIETNGGLHDTGWWKQLAKHNVSIDFALDGIDNETHQMYRRGVNFNKVLENAIAFKNAGGKSIWSMIEFKHNSHQLEQAKKMALKNGLIFKFKRSRVANHTLFDGTVDEIYRNKNHSFTKRKNLNKSDVRFDNKNKKNIKNDAEQIGYNSQKEYENFTEITCEWGNKNKFSIDYDGRVNRCCFFSSFYHQSPSMYRFVRNDFKFQLIKKTNETNFNWYNKKYGFNFNSLEHFELFDILNHIFYTNDLNDSFKNNLYSKNNPRIKECTKFCGELQTNHKKRYYNEMYKLRKETLNE